MLEELPYSNFQDQAAKDKALQSMAAMSSAQIVSASAIHNKAALASGLLGNGPPRPFPPGAPPVSKDINPGSSLAVYLIYPVCTRPAIVTRCC